MKKLSWSTGSCWIPICIALEKYSSALKKCGRDRNAGDLPLHWVTFWGRGDVHFLETHGEEKPALLLVSCSRSKSSRCKRFHWQKRRRPTGTWWRSPRTPHRCRALQGSQNLEPDYSHLEKESCLHASVDQREKLSFRLRRPGANSPSAEPVTWLHFPVCGFLSRLFVSWAHHGRHLFDCSGSTPQSDRAAPCRPGQCASSGPRQTRSSRSSGTAMPSCLPLVFAERPTL